MELLSDTPEKLYYPGPNYAADAIIIAADKICLIRRRDSGEWALPGGFVNQCEDSMTAAIREAEEETGLAVSSGVPVYSGRVDDPRNTDLRWIETDAYIFHTSQSHPTPGDDAIAARWWPIDSMPTKLYGSHRGLIEKGLIADHLAHVKDKQAVSGGHMAYNRHLVHHTRHGQLFVKSHDDSLHTDPRRIENSKKYLKHESYIFDYLRMHNASFIPSKSHLLANYQLVMDGLPKSDGWIWRAPNGSNRSRYLDSIFAALDELADIPPPDHSTIGPSCNTFEKDGWLKLHDAAVFKKVVGQINRSSPMLHAETASAAKSLVNELSALRSAHTQNPLPDLSYFTHHDFRQSNIAWHPDLGIRIIDWSWAGAGPRHADSTSLLIDLAKSGHNVSTYTNTYFDKDHALRLMGFWLAQSILPTQPGNEAVRLQQVASAITAYRLIIN